MDTGGDLSHKKNKMMFILYNGYPNIDQVAFLYLIGLLYGKGGHLGLKI